MNTSQCSWKLVEKDKFVLGMPAERCGEQATIRVIRPQRKTDLYLCEEHLNEFIDTWGLHYNVEVICPEPIIHISDCPMCDGWGSDYCACRVRGNEQ